MIRFAMAASAVLGLLLAQSTPAGKFNRKLSIGDPAPVWADLPGVDGKTHSLADLKAKEIVVVAITCNHCPIAVDYENRLIDFAKKHAGVDSKVALVAINVNHGDEETLARMIERAQKKGFPFPYLSDDSQKIGRAFGASVTPEFFVLNKDRKVVYMGAMDDDLDATQVKLNYVEAAVKAELEETKPATAETRGRGCGIAYESK